MYPFFFLAILPLLAQGFPVQQLSPPQYQQAVANQATVINSCPYPLYVQAVASNEPVAAAVKITPGWAWQQPIRILCPDDKQCGGISVKISKEGAPQLVTQFEYTAKHNGKISYDISFIDCVKGKDTSKCPGHEGGVKLIAANRVGCRKFVCAPGAWCSDDAYFTPEAGRKGAPVADCTAQDGVLLHMCSGA